jgi:hypothetical protein
VDICRSEGENGRETKALGRTKAISLSSSPFFLLSLRAKIYRGTTEEIER